MNYPVYFVMGPPGSGRRAVVADLITGGFEEAEPVIVAAASAEEASLSDEQLSARKATEVVRYSSLSAVHLREGATTFILAQGDAEPAGEIEAFQDWLVGSGGTLCRILTIVDCRLAERESALESWFDCCIHFADVVLLNNREGVSEQWMRAFEKHYIRLCYPCLFELVKQGQVSNPAKILDPVARRVSLLFDSPDSVAGIAIESDDLPEETVDLVPASDPWLERLPSLQRAKPVPDIRLYLRKD